MDFVELVSAVCYVLAVAHIFTLLQLLLIDLLADVSLHITVKQNDSFYGFIV